jgi:hypothetical protein
LFILRQENILTSSNVAEGIFRQIKASSERPQRVGYDRFDGSCIVADVVENAGQIVMNGSLTRDPQNVGNIAAHLDCHAATVPLSKVDNNAFMGAYRTANVLEIITVDATPHGKRIGANIGLPSRFDRSKEQYRIHYRQKRQAPAPFYTLCSAWLS